ncbi:MAG: hypothetical protein B7Y45_08085 [Sphingomonas sp. 28-66-16]|nr:MAG: hypothetical protein B7Y45_08085 [Sphingomonas sp. 28-66-16]
MQFLKTLFWFLMAVIAAVFTIGNWTTVQIRLWAGLVADVNLPLLLLLTFLSGLFPALLYHHAVKWRLRQKLATAERAIADLRGPIGAPAPSVAEPDTPIPPASVPTAVPPGVS